MRKPMRENTIARAAADRTAIERWENEGGLALGESPSSRPDDLPRSDSPTGPRLLPFVVRAGLEGVTRSSS
jgi:hypothetical protein